VACMAIASSRHGCASATRAGLGPTVGSSRARTTIATATASAALVSRACASALPSILARHVSRSANVRVAAADTATALPADGANAERGGPVPTASIGLVAAVTRVRVRGGAAVSTGSANAMRAAARACVELQIGACMGATATASATHGATARALRAGRATGANGATARRTAGPTACATTACALVTPAGEASHARCGRAWAPMVNVEAAATVFSPRCRSHQATLRWRRAAVIKAGKGPIAASPRCHRERRSAGPIGRARGLVGFTRRESCEHPIK